MKTQASQSGLDSTDLCDVCRTINFAAYFRNDDPAPQATSQQPALRAELGKRTEVRVKAAHCAFCYLADTAINALNVIPDDREATLSISRFLLADNRDFGQDKNGEKIYCMLIRAQHSETAHVQAYVQITEADAEKLGVTSLYRSRAMSSGGINMGMARKWLDMCLKQHGPMCSTPGLTPEEQTEPPQPVNLLAIDLQEMRICDVPFGGEFVALSYCWPAEKYLTLLKKNRQELSEKDALARYLTGDHLPGTICDAISCAKELSFRYLWIDALCIVQDDDDHKLEQLQQMDRVYNAAVLTIVCAYPVNKDKPDPCSGLPSYKASKASPIYPARSRTYRTVQGLRMTPLADCADYILSETRWNTRCWTFQENFLSRRLLFFTHAQVYWSCSCNTFSEDFVCEGLKHTAYTTPGSTLWSLRSRYTDAEGFYGEWTLTRAPVEDMRSAMRDYEFALSNYTKRQVSYASDMLNAFEGVAAVMHESTGSEFWQGLPEVFFDQALCWTLTGHFRRRRLDGGKGKESVIPFPSWSWAGWDSQVVLNNFLPLKLYRPEVEWFIVNNEGTATRLSIAHQEHEIQYGPLANKDVTPPDVDIMKFLPNICPRIQVDATSPKWRNASIAACWTTTARFTIDGTTLSLSHLDRNWPQSTNVAIKDQLGNIAGCILVAHSFAKECEGQPRKVEFILISRSLRLRINIDVHGRDFYKKLCHFDQDVYPDKDWCTLNVMLIRRSEGNQAERVGVGIIHEDAWVQARPEGQFIKLI